MRFSHCFLPLLLSLMVSGFLGCEEDEAPTADQGNRYDDFQKIEFKSMPGLASCFRTLDSPGLRVLNSQKHIEAVRDSIAQDSTKTCDSAHLYRTLDFERYTYLVDARRVDNCIEGESVQVVRHPDSDTITMDVVYQSPADERKCEVISCEVKVARIPKVAPGTPINFSGRYSSKSWCFRERE